MAVVKNLPRHGVQTTNRNDWKPSFKKGLRPPVLPAISSLFLRTSSHILFRMPPKAQGFLARALAKDRSAAGDDGDDNHKKGGSPPKGGCASSSNPPAAQVFTIFAAWYLATLGGEQGLILASPPAFVILPWRDVPGGLPPLTGLGPINGTATRGGGGGIAIPFGGYEWDEDQLWTIRARLNQALVPGSHAWCDSTLRYAPPMHVLL